VVGYRGPESLRLTWGRTKPKTSPPGPHEHYDYGRLYSRVHSGSDMAPYHQESRGGYSEAHSDTESPELIGKRGRDNTDG
jgi:hypothetical protein